MKSGQACLGCKQGLKADQRVSVESPIHTNASADTLDPIPDSWTDQGDKISWRSSHTATLEWSAGESMDMGLKLTTDATNHRQRNMCTFRPELQEMLVLFILNMLDFQGSPLLEKGAWQ